MKPHFLLLTILSIILCYSNQLFTVEYSPSIYVSDVEWSKVVDFLMPDDHPIKNDLDEVFSASRVICDMKTMVKAGFEFARPQAFTGIIVTKHPRLKGYVMKAYLDDQKLHLKNPEQYPWVKRVIGSRLIQKSIDNHHYDHLLKVPKKWVYLLPDDPSPPSHYWRKNFILIEEDMNILSDKKNKMRWRKKMTKELLEAIYTVIAEVSLSDCKLANIPFSPDGKVAFIDTQSHGRRVKYKKITPFLSSSMKRYWLKLRD